MQNLDALVCTTLRSFVDEVFSTGWYGKEREAVSLYAFGHLTPHCAPGSCLSDPRQIGIEVRVPQVPGPNTKAEVCKDLVVWPEPGWTCWDVSGAAVRAPLAVLEWKANVPSVSERDVAWLKAFTTRWPDCTGFAIALDLANRRFRLRCVRVVAGTADPDWLSL